MSESVLRCTSPICIQHCRPHRCWCAFDVLSRLLKLNKMRSVAKLTGKLYSIRRLSWCIRLKPIFIAFTVGDSGCMWNRLCIEFSSRPLFPMIRDHLRRFLSKMECRSFNNFQASSWLVTIWVLMVVEEADFLKLCHWITTHHQVQTRLKSTHRININLKIQDIRCSREAWNKTVVTISLCRKKCGRSEVSIFKVSVKPAPRHWCEASFAASTGILYIACICAFSRHLSS